MLRPTIQGFLFLKATAESGLYIDSNDFKKINDTKGHQEGDVLLQAVGGVLNKISRIEDACFSTGGDEFLLVLPNTDDVGAREVKNKIEVEISSFAKDNLMSIGCITSKEGFEGTFDELLTLAEKEMHKEKKSRKSK